MHSHLIAKEALTEIKPSSQYLHTSLDNVAVIILGGGEGKRLSPLTKTRCKPAISFGGKYALIDIPISHSISSGLRNIYIIGQYLANSLHKHLFQTYMQGVTSHANLHMLIPEEREGSHIWFKGTADAIRQNINYLREIPADYFLILSGDQLYNIDFQQMLHFGLESNADMVIAAQPVNEKEAKRMGLLKLQAGSTRVIDFIEKPQEPQILEQFATDEMTLHRMGFESNSGRRFLGSMGIYFFKRKALFDLVGDDPREDFGKHLILTQMKKESVHAFLYDGYWEDIGTIESYYNANLALTQTITDHRHGLLCHDEKNVIITKTYRLPGAKITDTLINRSLICEGAIIDAKEITHSVIGVRSRVGRGTVIRDSILMGNEYYHRTSNTLQDLPDAPGIGENCLITKTIIDENVKIGNDVKLINRAGFTNYDSPFGEPAITVRDGIIVVPRGTTLPNRFVF